MPFPKMVIFCLSSFWSRDDILIYAYDLDVHTIPFPAAESNTPYQKTYPIEPLNRVSHRLFFIFHRRSVCRPDLHLHRPVFALANQALFQKHCIVVL